MNLLFVESAVKLEIVVLYLSYKQYDAWEAPMLAVRIPKKMEVRLEKLAALTGRPEKMIGNTALLLQSRFQPAFQTACQRLRDEFAPQGLIVDVSGPWPPYHFCPALDH